MDSNTSKIPTSVGPINSGQLEQLARKAYESETGRSFSTASPQDRERALLATSQILQGKAPLADVGSGAANFGTKFKAVVLDNARLVKGWDENQFSTGYQAQYAGDVGTTDRGNLGIGSQQEQGTGMHAGGSNVGGTGLHGDPPPPHR